MTLVEMFDYFRQLTAQFPIRPLRVVYSKAGMQPAACILRNRTEIVENTLYWHAVSTDSEALFLVAILNSETARPEAERIAATFELPERVKFQRARKLIRDALTESGISPHIDGLVARLLDQSPANGDDE